MEFLPKSTQQAILTYVTLNIQQLDDYLNYEYPDLLLQRGYTSFDSQSTRSSLSEEEEPEADFLGTVRMASSLQRSHKSLDEQSVGSYIEYILDLSEATLEVIIHACILIQRFSQKSEKLFPVHILKLVTIAVYVSFKVIEDEDFASLEEISLISGIEEEDLLEMEREFCQMMDFQVVVLSKEFRQFVQPVLSEADFATIEGCENSFNRDFPKIDEENYGTENKDF